MIKPLINFQGKTYKNGQVYTCEMALNVWNFRGSLVCMLLVIPIPKHPVSLSSNQLYQKKNQYFSFIPPKSKAFCMHEKYNITFSQVLYLGNLALNDPQDEQACGDDPKGA